MLATVACDSARAVAMPRRSPLTSVTCALFIATSVPVPIAMPTSALASAGASLMPSPAIATTRPSRLQRLDQRQLVGRLDLAVHLVDAQALAARRVAVVRPSPVAMTTRRPAPCSAASASGVRRLDRVGHGEQAGQLSVDGQVHHAGALGAQRFGLRSASVDRRRRAAAISAVLPSASALPSTLAAHADARLGVELFRLRQRQPALARRRDDGRGQRMLAALVEAGGQAQHLVRRRSPARRPRARRPACPRSACRSCRRSACRPCAGSRSPRRRGTARRCVAPRRWRP